MRARLSATLSSASLAVVGLTTLTALPALAVSGAGCSSSSSSGDPSTDGGSGTDTGPGPTANEAQQTGRIVGARDQVPITGVTVSVGARSATTGGDGTYSLVVPKNTPYTMTVRGEEYYGLDEQEWILDKDTLPRGDTSLLSKDTANLLAAFLPARNLQKGLLVVRIVPMPPCDTEAGSTLAIEPAGDAKVTYFSGGIPSKAATSAAAGESFAAAFTDVEVGVNLTVKVDSPSCEPLPFPVAYSDVTYTGNMKAGPGEVLSYVRVFLGPKKATIADAGTD